MTVQLWTTYEDARSALTTALRASPALMRLSDGGGSNWIVSLCDAWGALAETVSFYQRRVIEEAFLATAEQASSIQLIYHSLGHAFPANATATTTIAYHLSGNVAGVEAVSRGGSAGGTGMSPQTVARLASAGGGAGAGPPGGSQPPAGGSGGQRGPAGASGAQGGAGAQASVVGALPGMPSVGTPAGITPGGDPGAGSALSLGNSSTVPAAAQVRAIPSASGAAPLFVTLDALGAYVGASRLAVNTQTVAPPPTLSDSTTLIELAGTQTGLAVGQPVLITAQPARGGGAARWIRLVSDVHADAKRGSTRISWQDPLGSLPGETAATGAADPVVYGFHASSALAGASAPAWSAQPLARQLQTTTDAGAPIPIRGGLASSADAGATWSLTTAGLPPGVQLSAIGAYGDVVIVSAGAAGLLRAVDGAPFAPTMLGGGSRRPVGFLGGTGARMLAGASAGVVYESLDQGQTWTAVSGGSPEVTGTGSTRQVTSNQLPSATVRCVIADPTAGSSGGGSLLAGTDQGVFRYDGLNWRAAPGLPAGEAVFAMLAGAGQTLYVASSTGVGVYLYSVETATWSPAPGRALDGAADALAQAAGDVYAATASGVSVELEGGWQAAGGGLPANVRISALLGDDGKLLAATDQGIYTANGTTPALTWTRCDHAPAFTVPAAALPAAALPAAALPAAALPAAAAPPGPDLLAAFAGYGIALDAAAVLSPAAAGYVLSDGAHSYGLAAGAQPGDPWQVTVLDAMPVATGLAQDPAGPVLAVGSPATSVANDWPGFAVAGSTVELVPPVRAVAPGLPAIIEQRSATPAAEVLDVSAVEQDTAVRSGRSVRLTRLQFSQTLPAGRFPRAASTVWTGAAVLPQFDPPNPTVQTLSGAQIELSSPLSAPVTAGQLVAVTGSPPGLAVAPLGGAMRVPPQSAVPTNIGPPQADLTGVAISSHGTVYLAGAEGVFTVAPQKAGITGSGGPQLLADGWPPGSSAGVIAAGDAVLAASSAGVFRLSSAPAGASATWSLCSPAGDVVALASDGTTVVAALAGGDVMHASISDIKPSSWTKLPTLSSPATTLAVKGSAVYAAGAAGVFALAGGSWTALGEGAIAGPDTCLQIDTKGTLWAGSGAGLQSYDPATGKWRREPQVAMAVEALCQGPKGVMFAAGAHAVGEQQGTEWNPVAQAPGATLGGMAVGADGSIWLATRTSVALSPASGIGSLQFSYATVLTGAAVSGRDLATLAQSAVPDTLLAALADAGVKLDPAYVVTPAAQPQCWLIRSRGDLYIVVERTRTTGSTLDVYANRAVLYPTAAPLVSATGSSPSSRAALSAIGASTTVTAAQLRAAEAGMTETWTVIADGTPATLTVQRSAVVLLPADATAPSFGETARLAATAAEVQAAPETVGATSTIGLEQPLQNIYDASTVQLNLNVVVAASGQPVSVPIGSGDPQQAHQTFPVPTPVAAIGATAVNPTASPATSLNVYVNGAPWSAVPSLSSAGPNDAVYVQRQNLDGSASVSFGDGVNGARLPAGQNNVVATYLQGGGPATEAAPGALLQALDRPQLVTAVHNPLPALLPPLPPAEQARVTAVRRLDRTITVADYEDLAASQAGVASASAQLLTGPLGRALVISVALAADAPDGSLTAVSRALGDRSPSGLAVRVATAIAVPVLATVQVVSSQPAKVMMPAIRSVLSGLPARKPGDPLYASQVLSSVTAVSGTVAAQIISWERIFKTPGTATSLSAAGASWADGSGAPTGAELLMIDGQQGRLTLDVVAPPV